MPAVLVSSRWASAVPVLAVPVRRAHLRVVLVASVPVVLREVLAVVPVWLVQTSPAWPVFARMARRMGGAFEEVLIKDIIPMVEKNYRVIADTEHRAMAGLSMGGMQTHGITLNNPTTFAYVGIFSGGTIGADELTDAADFKKTNKVLFMSAGGRETGMAEGENSVGKAAEDLKAIGINAHSYISPETAHEWQTWRRSLYQFAQLLFK